MSVLYWTGNEKGHFDDEFGREVTWDVDLLSGYSWRAVDGDRSAHRVASFLGSIRALRPDAIVCFGWTSVAARTTIVWCILTRTPIFFYGDTTWQHSANPRLGRLRRLLLRLAFRFAAGALSTGTFNREFYIHLGMHPKRVIDSVCPIDVDSYAIARGKRPGNDRRVNVIGFAGKLIPRKGVDELLRALAQISQHTRWEARIVGDGQERQRLEALARSLGIAEQVHFTGFRNTSNMPSELARCDIVVVPSILDMRVLVAAEAMAAGAVVVVSTNTAVWGRGDLVEDRVSGRVYKSGDASALARTLEDLLTDPITRAALQEEGAKRAASQGPGAFTEALERVADALNHPS
jgi:glycosyltransferase involved in cell wall biosynthesis